MIERSRVDLSGLRCSASFSRCERYRYLLTWRWSDGPLLIAWIFNPSTATEEALDPTIAGLIARARAWGLGGVRVINLFAWRATDPADMKAAADPVGPHNDRVTLDVLLSAGLLGDQVVCGWGAHGGHLGRDAEALDLARRAGVRLHAFGFTLGGKPRHPLYIAHAVRPQPWRAFDLAEETTS